MLVSMRVHIDTGKNYLLGNQFYRKKLATNSGERKATVLPWSEWNMARYFMQLMQEYFTSPTRQYVSKYLAMFAMLEVSNLILV